MSELHRVRLLLRTARLSLVKAQSDKLSQLKRRSYIAKSMDSLYAADKLVLLYEMHAHDDGSMEIAERLRYKIEEARNLIFDYSLAASIKKLEGP